MRVVDLIAAHVETHGYPPSIRELAKQMGLTHSTVHDHLRKAEQAGLIERVPGQPRAIRIVKGTK